MATESAQNGQKVWTVSAGDACTAATFVPAFGGVGSSLTLPFRGAPRETLFLHDFFWNESYTRTRGGWPFLFPVCGRMERGGAEDAYLYGGRVYHLPSHGFSLRRPWTVARDDPPDTLTMELRDDASTRAAYPFAFRAEMTCRVRPGALEARMEIENRSAEPLPYYAGFHPYFRTPPPGEGKDACRVSMTTTRQWLYNRDLTDIRGVAGPVSFPASVSAPEINETLNETPDGNVTRLSFPDGFELSLEMTELSSPGLFPFVQLYTIPEKPFFCIEPWMSHPNAMNAVRGVRWLPAGATDRAVLRVRASG